MALGAFVTTKSGLRDYIRKRLGYPIVNIEVTDDQIDIAINLAIEKFLEFGTGGVQYRYKTIPLLDGVQEYTMDFDVYSIIQVYSDSNVNIAAPFPDKVIADAIGGFQNSDLLTLELTREYVQTLDFMLTVKIAYEYNCVTRSLYFPSPVQAGQVGIAYYQRLDYSDEANFIYDNTWVKDYSYAKTKYQWGDNLTKYEGSVLPENLILNASKYIDEANTLVDKLENELQEVWRTPTNFFVG